MSGIPGLGPSDFGNPNAEVLRQDAMEGRMMPEVRRRLWTKAGDYQQDSTLGSLLTGGGVTTAMGKGIADANIGIFRGLHWLGSHVGLDFGMKREDVPSSLYDLLPQEDARFLASRIASANVLGKTDLFGAKIGTIGEVTGQILPLIASGGASAAGQGTGFVSKLSNFATGAPGSALKAFGAPGRAIGQRLMQIPQVARYTRVANALPGTISNMTGFGLYNFLTADGDWGERGGAMLHGMVAGAALKVAGEVAGAAERKMLDLALSPEQIAGLGRLGATLRSGAMPSWSQLKAAAAQTGAKSVGALVENTGFAMLNEEFWQAASDGDMEKAVQAYVQTLPAAVLARTGNPDAWRSFRREMPEMNDMGMRREMLQIRYSGQDPQPMPQGPREHPPGQPTEPVTNPKGITNTDTIYAGESRAIEMGMSEPGKAYGWPDTAPGQGSTMGSGTAQKPAKSDVVAQPLLHAGWDIPDGLPAQPGQVDLEFPGGGKVSIGDDGQISVTRSVFNTVRGDAEAARRGELDAASGFADIIIGKSFDRREAGSVQLVAKQQIDTSIDVDQARSLLGVVPQGSVLHKGLMDIVQADAPYGPVTVSGLEIARAIKAYRAKAGTDENSKRVNEWLNGVAEDILRWSKVEQHGEGSVAGKLASQARLPLQDWVDEMSGGIVMEGAVAEEFTRDLAAITMMRRMGGEIQFGGNEAWAGGPWKGDDGKLYQVGLDGQTYSISWPAKAGEKWQVAPAMQTDVTVPADRPELQRWMDLAGSLSRNATPNPGLDLLETALVTANSGNPQSRSVSELRSFLQSVNPDAIAPALTPATLESLGMSLGRIGSGNSTAKRELAVFQSDLQLQQQKAQEVEQPQPEDIDQELEDEIQGLDRSGEAGSIGNPLPMMAEAVGSVADAASMAADYMFETQAEVIRRALPSSSLSQQGRQAMSLGRTIRGESHTKWMSAFEEIKPAGRRKWADQWMVYENGQWREAAKGEDGEVKRWELVTDGRIKLPSDAPEWQKNYVAGHRGVNAHLYDTARAFGAVRGAIGEPDSARPLPQTSNYVTERREGKDADKVYGDHDLLMRWFNHLVNHPLNAEVRIKTPSGQKRKLTVRDLERQWQDESERITTPDSADVDAAFEHYRLLPHVPMRWRDTVTDSIYEMRESDVSDVMADVVKKQSKRAATIKVFGQDMSPKRRQAAIDWVTNNAATMPAAQVRAVLENMQARSGPTSAVKEFGRELRGAGGPRLSAEAKKKLTQQAFQWVKTIQGSPPPATAPARIMRTADVLPRAIGASLAFSWDIVEGLAGMPAHYGGLIRTMKAWRGFFRNPNEAVRLAWRLGSVTREMGELIWGEGHKMLNTAVNALGKVGELTESYKGALFSKLADVILDDWANGKALSSDYRLLSEMRFTANEANSLANGSAPNGLRNQFRNEFVQMLSSRREKGEGSAFSDSSNMQAIFQYARWASARAGQVLRASREVDDAVQQHGRFSRQAFMARARATSLLATFTVSGALGSLVGLLVTAALSGDSDRGAPRWWREASDAPGWFALRSLFTQTIAGPTGRVLSSMSSPNDARSLASMSVPTKLVYSLGRMIEAANRGDLSFLAEFASAQGYIPFNSTAGKRLWPRVQMWVAAAVSGEALSAMDDAMSDRDLTFEFESRPGVRKGWIGLPAEGRNSFAPTKDANFYAYMRKAMDAFYEEIGGVTEERDFGQAAEAGYKAALAYIEKARTADGVKPGTIQGYIRSQKHFNGWDAEKRQEFKAYAGADRMKRMRNHDRMLDIMAEAARDPDLPVADPEWQVSLNRLRNLVDVGDMDMDVVDQAVNYSRMELSRNPNAEAKRIADVSSVIAASDYAISKVFSGEKAEFLLEMQDHGDRAEFIEFELIDRAIRRADKESK